MQVCKAYDFGGIKAYKLGWAPVGPPMMTTHIFVLGSLMVDTGQAHMQNQVLQIAEDRGIRQVVLTHFHEDHSGNAAAIKDKLGISVCGHPFTVKKMAARFPILPYQKYVWGSATPLSVDPLASRIPTPFGEMTPIHTPGHSKDHTAFYIKDEGILISGDLYLADRVKFFRSDEDMGRHIDTLKKLLVLDFDMLLCSHYPKRENGKAHIRSKLDFLEELYGNIIRLWKQGQSEKEIFRHLELKENYPIKYFCFGNVCMLNGVRIAIRHYESEKKGEAG